MKPMKLMRDNIVILESRRDQEQRKIREECRMLHRKSLPLVPHDNYSSQERIWFCREVRLIQQEGSFRDLLGKLKVEPPK